MKKSRAILSILVIAGTVEFILVRNKALSNQRSQVKEITKSVAVNMQPVAYQKRSENLATIGTFALHQELKLLSEVQKRHPAGGLCQPLEGRRHARAAGLVGSGLRTASAHPDDDYSDGERRGCRVEKRPGVGTHRRLDLIDAAETGGAGNVPAGEFG
jgi:hypothetical protein